jgi:HAD superfamily hydrolase (TIGR01509 family)
MGNGMIRSLIFDFDGLILDTEVPEFRAWQEIFQRHGCELPLATWAACIGTSSTAFDPYAYLETLLGRTVDRDAMRAQWRQRRDELLALETVLPGVQDYLVDATRMGFQLGVASSSSRAWVSGHLARLGLLPHFTSIQCADDVQTTKPNPAAYQAVLAALNVLPGEAIALEDSPNGILAAKRAGLFCVAVPNGLTRHLPLDRADMQLASLATMPLARLLVTLRAAPASAATTP